MSTFIRPTLGDDFDNSRAADRRDDPAGWRFSDVERAAVTRVISERRDIRRFRPDPIDPDLVKRLLDAAHRAPSVGLMQPWRFVLVEDDSTKLLVQSLAQRERIVQADAMGDRESAFMDLKIEGIRDAPLNICVCCESPPDEIEILGRHTIPETDIYSTACAIENLWLAARAEGVGVGWVSFYQPQELAAVLGLPDRVLPIAYLCVGYPDERPPRPGLEIAGWASRGPVEPLIFAERYGQPWSPAGAAVDPGNPPGTATSTGITTRPDAPRHLGNPPQHAAAIPTRDTTAVVPLPDWLLNLVNAVNPGFPAAGTAVRDHVDQLVKPIGSLGALESLVSRWAIATGGAPGIDLAASAVILCGDHGVAAHGVSLFESSVSAQVAAAAARGETAVGVLARAAGVALHVVDVGLAGPPEAGVIDMRVEGGTQDVTVDEAITPNQFRASVLAGVKAFDNYASSVDCVVVGEIGIGNTTAASAVMAALCGLSGAECCGRGTGLDAAGLEHKRATVDSALARHDGVVGQPAEALRVLGGFEFAAMLGLILRAAANRKPIILDGFATGVVALAAQRLSPNVRDYLFASHVSAEPAHRTILRELGLEPLLDLRMRLGEGSGALLALPLITSAAKLHREMGKFKDL